MNGIRLIQLPKIADRRGNLSFIEGKNHIPFNIERIYYLYDVPSGEERGGHAHRELRALLIAASGSFDVILDDAREKQTITLNRPYQGLLIETGIWRELNNFSSGAVCLVIASNGYDEADYIRDYNDFLEYKKL